jgi:ADP-ribose pyrophosphatase
MTITRYKKKKLAKKYYELEFSLFQNGKRIKISENFQFNGHSVSAICYIKKEKIFYFIRQFRPNYHFNENKIFPLEIVAGGIDPYENPRQAIIREIKEEIGVKPISVKKICSLHVAPDCLDEITHLFIATVPKITNFQIFNNKQKELIEIVPVPRNKISEELKKNTNQNLVTRLALLEILKLKI